MCFVLFGWGKEYKKVLGEFPPENCGVCNNEVKMMLLRQRVWFTLFLIPVIPYVSKYYILCPICSKGYIIKRKEVKEILSEKPNDW